MSYAFDNPLPGETLLQYLERHHCGLNDPLNEGYSYTVEEIDALAENDPNEEAGFIIAPSGKPKKRKHGK